MEANKFGLDAFHINAVDKFDNGDYLFSARYTDTIYKVSVLVPILVGVKGTF